MPTSRVIAYGLTAVVVAVALSASIASDQVVGDDSNLIGRDSFCLVVVDDRDEGVKAGEALRERLFRQAVLYLFPMVDCITGSGSVVVFHVGQGHVHLYVIAEDIQGVVRPVVWRRFTAPGFFVPDFEGLVPPSMSTALEFFDDLVFTWRTVNR